MVKNHGTNDNSSYCLTHRYEKTLSEGVPVGSFVLSMLAIDAEKAENAKLRFLLTGNGSNDFILDESSGKFILHQQSLGTPTSPKKLNELFRFPDSGHLRTTQQLDRETNARYHLVAHIQDQNRSLECSSQIEINISDLNDNAPVFSFPLYTVSLPEDVDIGTIVMKIQATDADIDINSKINYTFIGSSEQHFKIIPGSGIITLAKSLDREKKEMYNLTVQAFDHGSPRLSSIAYVVVNVEVSIFTIFLKLFSQ